MIAYGLAAHSTHFTCALLQCIVPSSVCIRVCRCMSCRVLSIGMSGVRAPCLPFIPRTRSLRNLRSLSRLEKKRSSKRRVRSLQILPAEQRGFLFRLLRLVALLTPVSTHTPLVVTLLNFGPPALVQTSLNQKPDRLRASMRRAFRRPLANDPARPSRFHSSFSAAPPPRPGTCPRAPHSQPAERPPATGMLL